MTLQDALLSAQRLRSICFCNNGCQENPPQDIAYSGFCGCWCHLALYKRLIETERLRSMPNYAAEGA